MDEWGLVKVWGSLVKVWGLVEGWGNLVEGRGLVEEWGLLKRYNISALLQTIRMVRRCKFC